MYVISIYQNLINLPISIQKLTSSSLPALIWGRLSTLDISNNLLTSLPSFYRTYLPTSTPMLAAFQEDANLQVAGNLQVFAPSLNSLRVTGNPFPCSCHSLPILYLVPVPIDAATVKLLSLHHFHFLHRFDHFHFLHRFESFLALSLSCHSLLFYLDPLHWCHN